VIAVILTARPVEFDAVRDHLCNVEERIHPAGTAFYVGRLPDGRRTVALAEIGEGNIGTAVLTERAISFLRPDVLIFVGIAGRLMDDIELGDVVVPSRIYQLHSGMLEDKGFRRRPRSWEVDHGLRQIAQRVARDKQWLTDPPGVFFRPIVAGEVVLNTRVNEVFRQIRDECEDAAAIEMESAGMAQASFLNQALPAIAVRGISDTASGDKYVTDRAGWQERAARNAAAFAIALLTDLPPADHALAGRRAAIAELAGAEAATATVYRTVLHKIAEPGLPEPGARAPELTEWLGRLAGDGRDPGELDRFDRAIAATRLATDRLRARATGLMERRDELRGRFRGLEAMAVRLDIAERPAVAEGRARALDVLWTSPCDLRAATRAVNDYLRAVTDAREGRDR
jgi:nucleoside phosphorylase